VLKKVIYYKCFLTLIVVFSCCLRYTYAFQDVKYLGIEHGLSNNAVTCVTQDQNGFMWIGTYDGLNRYDGSEFKKFRNVWGDKTSLLNNHIKAVNAAGNRIFVGTEKGLMFYDYTDAQFHVLYYRRGNRIVPVHSGINQIKTDNSGNTYVATEADGLIKFKISDSVGIQLKLVSQVSYNVQALAVDQSNKLWLYSSNFGLCRYNQSKDEVEVMLKLPLQVSCLISDTNNDIWLGTESGIYIYNQTNKSISTFPESKYKLTSKNIFNLTITHDGNIWISTNGGGINIWNNRRRELTYLTPGETENSLRSGAVTSVYEDNENRIWITTLRGGVNIVDDKTLPFHLYTHKPYINSVVNNFILSFCEDELHNIWIGTDGGGLSYWNTKSNFFTNFTHKPATGYLSSNFVVSIVKDYKDQIWVATFNGGIDVFNTATQRFKHYSCVDPAFDTEEKHIWKLFEDSQHRIWAGSTWGGALYVYNRNTDKFDLFDRGLANIHTLFQDRSGNLWAGDYTHLIKIDINYKKHRRFFIGQSIRAIAQDAKDNLWIGTDGGGLIKFNTATNKSRRFTEADGLPSNSVLNILTDNKGKLWCSTYNGLSSFDTQTGNFTNYFASDGLQSNQFNYNAALKLSSGKMLFGGIKGYNLFHPDSIGHHTHVPKLQLTDFRINNLSVESKRKYRDYPSLHALHEITIPFDQATIAVTYTALEYSYPEKISYAYYLEGWDHNWNHVGKLKSAHYTRLNEGKYILKIKATNTEGIWSSDPLIVYITVLPPWYRTWWAYLLYISAISAIAYSFWLYHIRQTKLRYAVQIANLKVEREKELNEKKLNFFTNISHELRTPLTLIVNPIKDILNNKESGQEKNDLNVVYRNSRRLLSLVDQLLLFRKTESENDVLNIVKINLFKFAKEIFLCFGCLAKNNSIDYTFECDDEETAIYADRDKMEIVFFNLLSNALKFTPKGGFVKFKIVNLGTGVRIEVSDSGPGIPEDIGDKLFDKFYKVASKESLKMGFGIGLYLVKSFVELHKGKISFSSNKAIGITFTIEMPVGEANEIIEDTVVENNLVYVNELIAQGLEEKPDENHVDNLELLISDLHSILVVDDNTEIIDYIKKIFLDNFKIYKATNGIDGLAQCREFLPDIVISDINMDGLNGIELCKAIKEDSATNHIPVILLTADPSPEAKLKGAEAGAYDFISKPFDKELFSAKINGIIKSRTELQLYFYNEITLKSDTHKVSQEDKRFLQKCITIIEDNLIEDSFSVKTLASGLGMSHSNLYKRIKATSGLSVNGFVRFIRLRKAAELLINTNLNINEAAFRVGINDIKYFREQFQKLFKLMPSEFVKKHRKTFRKYYNINSMS
jgi:signal transduction histidine kinase/ligand-binding sensor domain-containing protein/AraC-like DNA-binding protein/ActR/RegA family two-component response regulator